MIEDLQEEQRKKIGRVRSFMDFIMGFILFLVGIYFLCYEKLGINVFRQKHSPLDYLIGALFILYGLWRIYRGYKKDYFK